MNKNLLIVAFCVVAGIVVTACQPQLMNNEDELVPESSPNLLSTPLPTGVPVSETNATPKASTSPAVVNAQIDTSLTTFDAAMNEGNPNDLNGKDLN